MECSITNHFTSNLSNNTISFLTDKIGTWDRFHTPSCNQTVTHHRHLSNPTTLIFRDHKSGHTIVFTIDSNNHVTMTMPDASSIWQPISEELLHLIISDEVADFEAEIAAEEAYKAKKQAKTNLLQEISLLSYEDIGSIYDASNISELTSQELYEISLIRKAEELESELTEEDKHEVKEYMKELNIDEISMLSYEEILTLYTSYKHAIE